MKTETDSSIERWERFPKEILDHSKNHVEGDLKGKNKNEKAAEDDTGKSRRQYDHYIHAKKPEQTRLSARPGDNLRQDKASSIVTSSSVEQNQPSKNTRVKHDSQTIDHFDMSDSDPLDEIIGPKPPPSPPVVRTRGRGAISAQSGIDSRFASTYNPTDDVQPDYKSGEDWDMALEAYRDRQRWKQQGIDRMKAAGWTDDQLKSWETSGGERKEEDVKWKREGEGREWDRGKVLDPEGNVESNVDWARLNVS